MLQQVVANNDKQRFQLYQGSQGLMLRAVQGHTIRSVRAEEFMEEVKDWEEVSELSHATDFDTAIEILRSGNLSAMTRNHVHFTLGDAVP